MNIYKIIASSVVIAFVGTNTLLATDTPTETDTPTAQAKSKPTPPAKTGDKQLDELQLHQHKQTQATNALLKKQAVQSKKGEHAGALKEFQKKQADEKIAFGKTQAAESKALQTKQATEAKDFQKLQQDELAEFKKGHAEELKNMQ